MTVKDLCKHISAKSIIANNVEHFTGIAFDSRKIEPNYLFVATRGTVSDGHDFIVDVCTKGATVVVCEFLPENPDKNVCWIVVENSSLALSHIAAFYYDFPSEKLKLVGVTGTNGKTTIATTLYNLTTKMGYRSGLLSTVKNMIGNDEIAATHTTPDAIQLNMLLAKMVNMDCEYCFMEVSSHSIVQHRVASLRFVGGIFTNITHDHLDYHKTFDDYIKAKKTFFDNLTSDSFAVTNLDDKNGMVMLQNTIAKKYTYSLQTLADFKAKIIESHFDGMLITINEIEMWSHFVGRFNVSNLLCVYAAAVLLGFEKQEVLVVLSTLHAVDGRFQTFRSKNGITAIVDYAHTPDALKNVLSTIQQIREFGVNIITVVGAGGNRDKTKRPEMAQIVAELSDKVILTSDNPRNEDPLDILCDMEAGIPLNAKMKTLKIADRKEAIRTAFLIAKEGDVILIAGKGHETYQEIKGVKYHFDDREIINEIFNQIN